MSSPSRQTRPRPHSLLLLLLPLLLLVACGDPVVSPPVDASPDPAPDRLALHVVGQPDGAVGVDVPFGGARKLAVTLTWPTDYTGLVELSVDAADLPAGVALKATSFSVAEADLPVELEFTATNAVSAADLGRTVSVTITATTAEETSAEEVEAADLELTVAARALVTSAEDAGPGTLRALVSSVPTTVAAPTLITFDPATFGAPTSIQLASSITFGEALVVRGPVDADGAPLVELNGGGASQGLVGVKDGVTVTLDSLRFTGSARAAIVNQGDLTLENSEVIDNGTYDATTDTWQVDQGGGVRNTMGTLTLRNSRITGNRARQGGGLFSGHANDMGYPGKIVVDGSFIENNHAFEGGGIFNMAGATLEIVGGSFVDGNESGWTGGGVHTAGHLSVDGSTFQNNSSANGGGIFLSGTSSVAVAGSLFHKNSASTSGGGLFVNGPATLLNSTLADNEAARGGGIFSSGGPTARAVLSFSTLAWNKSSSQGGGIHSLSSVELRATIVARNSAGDGGKDVHRGDGTVTSLGYNLILSMPDSGITLLGSDISGVDPKVTMNPGTYGPAPKVLSFYDTTSPAINAIPLAECTDATGTAVLVDQTGTTRPGAGPVPDRCDIGALEAVIAT